MTAAQDRALAHVQQRAIPSEPLPPGACVTINLHPDRIARDGSSVLQAFLESGEVRTQFETGISAGGLDGIMGGARSGWERSMFGAAYDTAPRADRPRYGALALQPDPWGAAPRFGSGHLRLREHMLCRATYTWGDSFTRPEAYGVWGHLGAVLTAAAADRWRALAGQPRLPEELLDTYVEAQVHARVSLADDVEALVLDEALRGSDLEQVAHGVRDRYGLALEWAPARTLTAEALDPEFRTELTPLVGREVQDRYGTSRLDARVIGAAARDVALDHDQWWRSYGSSVEVLQEIKYLWHHLVRFGTPSTM